MRGTLTGGLPSSLKVDGELIPIHTDWRVWIDVWRLVDNPTADKSAKVVAILALIFPREGESPTPFERALKSPEAALMAAMDFLARKRDGEQPRPKTARERRLEKKRLLDWDYDADRLIADFEREYRIDLTDPETRLHWWRFMALFGGLSDTSQMIDAIRTRAADLSDKGLSKEARSSLKERKIAVMLPARTKEEAAQNSRIRGA